MAISDTARNVSLGITGQEQLTMTDVDTMLTNGASNANFGIGWTGGTIGDTSLFIDDIGIDTAPISCR